jgi:hypothetical protein
VKNTRRPTGRHNEVLVLVPPIYTRTRARNQNRKCTPGRGSGMSSWEEVIREKEAMLPWNKHTPTPYPKPPPTPPPLLRPYPHTLLPPLSPYPAAAALLPQSTNTPPPPRGRAERAWRPVRSSWSSWPLRLTRMWSRSTA